MVHELPSLPYAYEELEPLEILYRPTVIRGKM